MFAWREKQHIQVIQDSISESVIDVFGLLQKSAEALDTLKCGWTQLQLLSRFDLNR